MPECLFDARGQTVLITGAHTGIGLGIAEAFAQAGASVIATGLPGDDCQHCRETYSDWDVQTLDVTDAEQVADLVSSLKRLDCLVNCAGILLRRGAEFELENFERVLNVNLTGTMRMSVAARPLLQAAQGSIVNVASMLSFFGSGFVPAYSASKGGVAQLTKSLAIAWAEKGIRVNAVAPGWIATPMTQPLVDQPDRSATILARTPQQRWGTPADVAGAVLFLSSSTARFITGVILPVDGGFLVQS